MPFEPQTQRRIIKNVSQGLKPFRTAGATSRCNRRAAAEADVLGKQQLKRMKLGSSSLSGHNQGAAAEACRRNRKAAAEVDEIEEQHLKRTQIRE